MSYTIDQISDISNLSKATLRYYEQQQLIPHIQRDINGYRTYTEENLEFILFLVKVKKTGMPLSEIKRFCSLLSDPNSIVERRQILLKHKEKLEKEQAYLEISLNVVLNKLALPIYDID
ncbi:MerR family transcriptional regulator [Leuconostoc suionicum]|uniref:MerR family transcriptional regulator n=1 Tax=Leuconostoc suionicum TaxID=1511761 RepID=UPI001B8CAD27|nr:MerR family transcriptional regulator [Leuconostoc suionicum]MBS1008230.1 MerR family transcriptional regulator [Leuconostoc suionicum]